MQETLFICFNKTVEKTCMLMFKPGQNVAAVGRDLFEICNSHVIR